MSIYAVNGKEPIAAWIPSLDTAGNGTTTLTDLVGSNNGTLTNMDAATDWVADTDAGGVRALDFDGSNDYVAIPSLLSSAFSLSLWVRGERLSDRRIFAFGNTANSNTVYGIGIGTATEKIKVFIRSDAGVTVDRSSTSNGVNGTAGSWRHLLWSDNAGTAALWIDGIQDATNFSYTPGTLTPNVGAIGCLLRATAGFFFQGRIDDVRIFNQALSGSDVAYLYNGGLGRGITASGGGIIPILRQHYAAQGAR